MKNRFKYLLILCCTFLDISAIMYANNVFKKLVSDGYFIWKDLVLQNLTWVAVISWILSALIFRLHHYDYGFNLERFYRSSWRVFLSQWIIVQTYILVFQGIESYHFNIGSHLLKLSFLVSYLFFSRLFITYIVFNIKKWQSNKYNVAIWGFNETSVKLASELENGGSIINFKGILNEDGPLFYKNLSEFKIALVAAINQATKKNIQELYVVVKPIYLENINLYFDLADSNCLRLKFIPDFHTGNTSDFVIDNIHNTQIIKPRKEPLEIANNRFKKRLFDMVFSTLILVLLLSWLYPILAIIIKLQSKGPVIFKQLRTGENNKEFWCYKFRSMHSNKNSETFQVKKDDNRVTAIGRFMRKTSIDELPQFYNVLKGEMSIVGPRPHMLKHTFNYNQIVENFMVRHFIKPGITGLSQISGFRGGINEVVDMQNRIDTDILYLKNWSMITDVKICILTIFFVFKGDQNAY